MLRLDLPPRGALAPNDAVDPLKYYYAPVVGRLFAARIDLGLGLLDQAAAGRRLGRLLEVGYGSGLLLPTLARAAEVVDGIDLTSEPAQVRAALARLGTQVGTLWRGSICALPDEARGYDAVIAFSILEHLRRPELVQAFAAVHGALAPGGHFLVGCPAVHKGMSLAFAAIGFRGIDDHHVSSIHDVLAVAADHGGFTVATRATLPRLVPFGLAPYNAVLFRRRS